MLIVCFFGAILPPVALVWCVMPVLRVIDKNYIALVYTTYPSCLENEHENISIKRGNGLSGA